MLLLPLAIAAPPSIDTPLRTGVSTPADAAVVIGIEHYPLLGRDVPYAEADARAVADTFVYTRGIPLGRVLTLTGSATREDIVAGVRDLGAQVHSGGTLFVFFAGHGAAAGKSRTLLGADVKATTDSFAARGVQTAEISTLGMAGGGRVVMLVDACFGGASRDGRDLLKDTRFVVPVDPDAGQWAATAENQVAAPLAEARHGLFTYLAVGAMRGWADGEISGSRDGVVTTDEAQAWMTAALRTMGRTGQTPTLAADLVGFKLTRGAKERIDPAVLATLRSAPPATGTSSAFGDLSMDVAGKVRQQECDQEALRLGTAARSARLDAEADNAAAEASEAWKGLSAQARACQSLDASRRSDCANIVDAYIARAEALTVTLTAGEEAVVTSCGAARPAFNAETRPVRVAELAEAKGVAAKLRQAERPAKPAKPGQQHREAMKLEENAPGEVRATGFVMGGAPLLSAGLGARWPSGVVLGASIYFSGIGLVPLTGVQWMFAGGGPYVAIPVSGRWSVDLGVDVGFVNSYGVDVGLPLGVSYAAPKGFRVSASADTFGTNNGTLLVGISPEVTAGWQW